MNDTKYFLRTSFGHCSKCRMESSVALAGGICLRCAAERILAFESGEAATLPVNSPRPTESEAVLPLPDRVGPYEIIEEIEGARTGRRFVASRAGLGRIVTLKVTDFGNPERAKRTLHHAQAAAQLRHPGIVQVHDCGRTETVVYVSTEYVEGPSLAHRLQARPFAVWEAAALLHKLAGVLAYAHGQGVLHGSLKPSNILLECDEPRVTDFGCGELSDLRDGLLQGLQATTGAHYRAPEMLREGARKPSVAADVYALGVILFEMLTGRTPFAGASLMALPVLVANTVPPPPSKLAPAVPLNLATICLKCLERRPSNRYATVDQLVEDLGRFLDGQPIVAQPAGGWKRWVRWSEQQSTLVGFGALATGLALGFAFSASWRHAEKLRLENALAETAAADAEHESLQVSRTAEAAAIRPVQWSPASLKPGPFVPSWPGSGNRYYGLKRSEAAWDSPPPR